MAPFRRAPLTALLVFSAVVAFLPSVEAHPSLVGRWVSPTPNGGFIAYEFCLGEHLGNGLWRGRFRVNVSDQSFLEGPYELRMFDDHQATLGPMATATSIANNVGLVDFNMNTFVFMNTTFRRNAGGVPIVTEPLPAPLAKPEPKKGNPTPVPPVP